MSVCLVFVFVLVLVWFVLFWFVLATAQIEIKCNKKFDDLNGRTAMMIHRCANHGVMIGRHMIKKGEGVNDIFSPYWCCWETPPLIAISDFMCVGLPYFMARDVKGWEDSTGALDEFHGAKNHYACSIAFSMKRKKDYLPSWFVLHDQVCEQRNRNLARMKIKGSWMRLETFMLMTSIMFEIDNRILLKKFFPNGCERNISDEERESGLNWWDRLQKHM